MNLHPAHAAYLKKSIDVPLATLFQLIDACGDNEHRDEAFFQNYLMVIKPDFREAVSVHETQSDLIEQPVGYKQFKEAARRLVVAGMPEQVLVVGIVHNALALICGRANSDIEEIIDFHKSKIEQWGEDLEGEMPDWQRTQMEELVAMSEKHVREYPARVEAFKRYYVTFCEKVLDGLMKADEVRAEQTRQVLMRYHRNRKLSTEEFPGAPKEPG
jgi:hypothetical protein